MNVFNVFIVLAVYVATGLIVEDWISHVFRREYQRRPWLARLVGSFWPLFVIGLVFAYLIRRAEA